MPKMKAIWEELKQLLVLKFLKTKLGKWLLEWKTNSKTAVLHQAVGQLVFSDTKKPLHNIQVELWDRDISNLNDFLGQGVTDKNGYFEIDYNPHKAGTLDPPDLELRIIETRFTFDANNQRVISNRLAYTIKGKNNVTSQNYDFGTCSVPYWVYNPNTPFPRVLFTDLDDTPDEDAIGRKLKGYEVAADYQPLKFRHLLQNKLSPNQPSLADIQKNYPPNLTIELEDKTPGYTRSDKFLGLRVLNGMNPCLFKQNQNNPNQYKVIFNWDAYEKNDTHDLHNVDATFEIKDGKLLPVAITIQTRKPDAKAPFSELTEPVTYTPENSEKWLQAKRIFRTNYLYNAELIEHYVKAHLQMEQYAIAAFRNLRNNPVRLLLIPHLKCIININRRADTVLVSESGYITTAGPLTWNSVQKLAQDVMQQLDWQAWKPRKPLIDSHTYAKIANLYWDVLTDYVDCFFEKHQAAIQQEWFEVRALSDDLVEHSVPYQDSRKNELEDKHTSDKWYDYNEIDKSDIPRTKVNGVLKAVRPITFSNSPQSNDIENLKQFCRYVIFHTTLWHSWVNDLQPDDGGEVAYSSIALRNGSFGSEEDTNIAPTPDEATQLLFLMNTLSQVKYGYILKNEDGDIPQEFRTILSRHRQDFAKLSYEINNIRSLINI